MVLTKPRFIVTEVVEPGDQIQIVLQGQCRIDAGHVEWREKNAETQAGCHRHVLHRRLAASSERKHTLQDDQPLPQSTLRARSNMVYRAVITVAGKPGRRSW